MRMLCCTILLSLLVGCASSVKTTSGSKDKHYAIMVDGTSKINRSTLKKLDSLTGRAISERIAMSDSSDGCRFAIHIQELKWFCPDRSKIEAEGFAVGFAGGLIGASIWGTKNHTTVYGISNIHVEVNRGTDTTRIACADTINFQENYLNYSSSKTKTRAICGAFEKSIGSFLSKLDGDAKQEGGGM